MAAARAAVKETRFHSEPPALKGQQESTFYLTVLTWYIRLGCCCVGLCYGIFLDSITSLTGYYSGEQGWCGDDRLFTVLLFFCKIVEIDRFALRPAILHECQNYLEVFSHPPPLTAIIPDAHPLGTFENQVGRH